MASSGTISAAIRTGYAIQIAWTVDSQSVANNTSTITAKVQLVSTGSAYTIISSASKSGTLTINGVSYSFNFTADLSANQTKTIFTKTVTISHNADGSKTCAFACSCGLNVTLSGTYYGTVSASGNGVFNTIARASTFTTTSSVSVNGTNTCAVTITRASSNFTHTVVWKIGSYSYTATGVATSTSYAIPMTWLNAIPNATSGSATVTVTTYSGSTKVGTASSQTFTISVPTSVVPTISTVSISEAVSGLNTQFQGYVQNKSQLAVNITAAGVYSSTIASYKTVILGSTYTTNSFTTGVITSSGSVSVAITVTDSRGRTATTTRTVTVNSYTAPTISTFNAVRSTSSGTENAEGAYAKIAIAYNVASVNSKNTCTYKMEYKKTSETTWKVLEQGTAYTRNTSIVPTVTFDVDSAFDIRVTLKDFFTTVERIIEIPTAFTLIDINANGKAMAFGKVSELTSGIEFAMPVLIDHKVLWSGSLVMDAGQGADLIEPISIQTSGIVLVFSQTDTDYHWNSFFIHKSFVALHEGTGSNFIMTTEGQFTYIGSKFIYIRDVKLGGNANNVKSGTTNGIKFDNTKFVLRYVIGV